MTYNYENAKKICSSYYHLIGKPMEEGHGILEDEKIESVVTDICIVPFDAKEMDDFLELYKSEDAQNSLLLAGYDIDKVRIVVIFEQTLTAPGLLIDLDEYLTKNNLEKKYNSSGVFIGHS